MRRVLKKNNTLLSIVKAFGNPIHFLKEQGGGFWFWTSVDINVNKTTL